MLVVWAALLVSGCLSGHLRQRKQEFEHVQKSDLLHFDVDAIQNEALLEFDAFDQHYVVRLQWNEHHNPAYIRHANLDPAEHNEFEPHFSSLTESCHFGGQVVNSAEASLVSITMCNKRGVRGYIKAFNETLWIYPSAYYLNPSQHFYEFGDEHLVWRQSDLLPYDGDNPLPTGEGVFWDSDADTFNAMKSNVARAVQDKRRLQQWNGGVNQVEVALMTGPVRTNSYQAAGGNWYDTMLADYYDIFTAVSSEYETTNWGTDVGDVSLILVEMEVLFDFYGRYASMAPNFYYSNAEALGCDDYSQEDNCRINGDDFLNKISAWVSNYKDPTQFDVLHFAMDIKPDPGNAGRAWVGTVCSLSGSSSGYSSDNSGAIWFIKVLAHEIGHNWGMSHDGDGNSCDDTKIMGSGTDGFSSCSITYLDDYFTESGGLDCLGDGVRSFSSNADNTGRIPTPLPTSKPTAGCYEISGLDNVVSSNTVSYSGEYLHAGTSSAGHPYYQKGTDTKLLRFGTDNGWCISANSDLSKCGGMYAYCTGTSSADVSKCTQWSFYDWGSGAWDLVTGVDVIPCGSTPNPTSPTQDPTTSAPTPPTPDPTASPTIETHDCFDLTNLFAGPNDLTGLWNEIGSNTGVYLKDGSTSRYLCFDTTGSWDNWCVVSDATSQCNCGSIYAYCSSQSGTALEDCSAWSVYNWDSGQFESTSNVGYTVCSPPTPPPSPTPAPTASPSTASPTTGSPTTSEPTTGSPTSAAPTTSEPTSAAPTSASPTTASPTTTSPTTASPTSAAPTTAEPTLSPLSPDVPTASPTTASPTTASPTTTSPTTGEPTSASPTTATPTTATPTTASPTSASPTTATPTSATPTTASPTTSDPTAAPSVAARDCVTVNNLLADYEGTDFNGQWDPAGTVNGQSYYTKSGLANRYLCFHSNSQKWMITLTAACVRSDTFADCRIATTDITACSDNWQVKTTFRRLTRDRDMSITLCNAATLGFLTCSGSMQENVCISGNNTHENGHLWSGSRTLTSFDKEPCKNGQPVYHLVVYNESISDSDDPGYITANLYLHYYQFGNLFSKWILSVDEFLSSGVAECGSPDLLACTSGAWQVLKQDYDSSQLVLDASLSISDFECGYVAPVAPEAQTDDDTKQGLEPKIWAVIGVCIALFVVAVVVCVVIGLKWKKKKQHHERVSTQGNEVEVGRTSTR